MLLPMAMSPKALKSSAHVIEESFHVGGQEHFYIEGQVALALPEEKGGMTVYSSTQHPTEIQHCIAKMLKVPDAMVTCECRRMGGAFGGKESQAAQWAALGSARGPCHGATRQVPIGPRRGHDHDGQAP